MKDLWLCMILVACGSSAKTNDDDQIDAGDQSDADTTKLDSAFSDAMVCTANTQVDPSNCGICGRSCLGGSCSFGMCATERMDGGEATGYGDVYTDNLFLYYTAFVAGVSPHRIWRRPIGVGNASYVGVLTMPTPMSQIAFFDDNFYVAEPNRIDTLDRGSVRKMNKEPFTESALATFLEPTTTAVLVHNGFVYWATDIDGDNGGDIKKMAITGGAISTITVAAGFVEYMKTDGTNIYWVGGDQLKRAPLAAGPPIAMGAATSKAMDVDATKAYTLNDGSVVATPLGGGAQISLGGVGLTAGVSADDGHIYAAQDGNKLVAVPKAGGSPITMWTEPAIDIGGGCFLEYKVTRVKVITDRVYFSAQVVNSCGNTVNSEGLYRTPRM